MFTEEELKALVARKIFERGIAYFEDGAVGSIRQEDNVFKARVRGTETYRVSLKIRPTGPPTIACDCPYDYGDVCKHGIALGLAVLDLVKDGDGIAQPTPAAPAVLNKAEKLARVLNGAWSRTSDKEKLAFLRQLLAQKPNQLRRFLEAFEFDKNLLAALPVPPKLVSRPTPKAKATHRPAPRRPLTLTEQAHELLDQKRGADLLPLLLTVDWLQNTPAWDTHTLPYLLSEAARFQPEATLDAVMERFESFLENKVLRAYPLYNRLAACLKALVALPTLTKQAQLFASELVQQYRQLRALRESLARAGFFLLAPEEATGLPLKRRKPKPEDAAAPPKRRGRQPQSSPPKLKKPHPSGAAF